MILVFMLRNVLKNLHYSNNVIHLMCSVLEITCCVGTGSSSVANKS